ncbi:MAG: CBS domain-containing protein [Pirellulaceae bacterium]|nr:CBS domain-containing protein [Pirellulaceae bacterium]
MTSKDLDQLTAADIMQRDVVAIGPHDTLQDAMALMTENHVTGLPVMDSHSRCVGLISATDILNYEQEHAEYNSEVNSEMARHFDPDTQRWESVRVSSYALEEFGNVPVEDVMARELIHVERGTPLREVAEAMVKHGVHRVLVLNDERALFGIVSAMDFVKLFARP